MLYQTVRGSGACTNASKTAQKPVSSGQLNLRQFGRQFDSRLCAILTATALDAAVPPGCRRNGLALNQGSACLPYYDCVTATETQPQLTVVCLPAADTGITRLTLHKSAQE